MKDTDKTKGQLIEESVALRQRIADLEAAEAGRKQPEQQVRLADDRLAYLLSASSIVTYAAKPHGDYAATFISSNIKQMTGYEDREFTERSGFWYEHIHPEDRQRVAIEIPKLFEKNNHSYEYRFRCKDGQYIWVSDQMKLAQDKEGNPVEIIGVWSDITERKQIEEALRQSEQRYRLLAENTKDMILRIQVWPELKFDYVSPSATALTGYTPEERYADPKLILKLIHPEDRALAEAMIQKPDSMAQPVTMRYIRKDGAVIWVETQNTFKYDKKGRLFSVDGIIRDITERKLAEDELKKSEQRLRETQSLGRLGSWEYDLATQKIEWSEEMYGLFERDKALGPPSPEEDAHYYTPEELRRLREFNSVAIKEGKELAIDATANLPSGKTIFLTGWIRPVRDKNGRVTKLLGTSQDITERKQIEEKLRENEARYRAIFEQAAESIILAATEDLAVVEFNDSAHQSLGYSREEFAKLKVPDFDAIESIEENAKRRKKVTEERIDDVFETKHRTKSGELRDVQVSVRPIRIGGRDFVLGVSRDITERKKAEEELRKFKAISDAASYGIVIANADGIFEYVNQAFAIMHGYSVEELLGKHFSAMRAAEQMKRAEELHNQLLQKGGYIGEEIWHRRKDGTVFPASMNATAIRDDKGNPLYFAVTSIDITERKQAEIELRLRSELLDSATDSIFVHDHEGNFIYVNEMACRVHGYRKDEFMKLNLQDIIVQERILRLESDFQEMLKKGQVVFESTHKRKDGSLIPVEVHGRTIELGNRKLFLTVIRDIAERKKVEEERKQLEQRAQLASRLASVGELASGVAHEINNPLTGVIGYAHLLLTKKDIPQDIKHDIEVINEGAQRVAVIVRKLLTFARQSKPERREVDINEIIGSTLDLRAYQLASNNIKVTQRLVQDLPMTIADSGQLQQVFLNLIVNAETEMKLAHGGGKLLIKTEQVDNTIRISFKDNGPGIAKKNLEKIFDPFFTTREVGQGTGLGLSLCHGIMTEHKGKIYAESKLGKGATFIMELPITTEDRQLEMPEPAMEEPKNTTKAKILVVDDELVIRQFVSQVLSEEGHNVDAVDKAEDALEKIKSERYRLILLDIKMPGMSGIELYKQLQKIAPSLAKRVVFITGDVLGKQTTAFLAKTKAPYIMKPFEAEQLKTKIGRILTENI